MDHRTVRQLARQLDLRLLRYFVAVAEEGNLTRAAARLGIQQPPLSQQIQHLEAALGVSLFERLARGMALTQSGAALLDEALALFTQIDRVVARVQGVGRGQRGNLATGFTSSAAFHPIVPIVIQEFRRKLPGVVLALHERSTAELIEALRDRQLDAAFVRLPVGQPTDLMLESLFEEEMLVALPSIHPMAGSKSARRLALSELADESFVLYRRPSAPGLYDAIIAACRAAGFSPRIEQQAPRMLSTLSLVAAGLGVTVVPESISRVTLDGVAYRRLSRATEFRVPLYLAYRMDNRSAATDHLIAQVRECVASFGKSTVSAGVKSAGASPKKPLGRMGRN